MIAHDWGYKHGKIHIIGIFETEAWPVYTSHSNEEWIKQGKWKQERPVIGIYTETNRILLRKMKKLKMI